MPGKIKRGIVLIGATCAIAFVGCHSETQQQKFIEAMNRGNGGQANQIWLNMSAKDRTKFAHSQGMQPDITSDDVKKEVMQHYQDEMRAKGGDESVEQPTPNVHLGGLQSLPGYVGRSDAPSDTATVPAPAAPSN
jgi:hypothetical protein